MTLMSIVVEIGMDVLGGEDYLKVRSVDFLKRWREEQRRDIGVEIIEFSGEKDLVILQRYLGGWICSRFGRLVA